MKTEDYIHKIIEGTGLSKVDIQKMVQEKKEELKGLISDDGALFIIAKELGVDVKQENNELLKEIEINVSDIRPNMKNIMLAGRIKLINEIFEFTKKQGGEGKVGSFILSDKDGEIRVTLWDDHTEILKNPKFEINEVVKIINGYSKIGKNQETELHIGTYGKIIIAPDDVDYKKYPKITDRTLEIDKIDVNQKSISLEGKVMQVFPIREFTKKQGGTGKVGSITLMDSTGSIRITFWNEDTDKINTINPGDYIIVSNLNPKISSFDNKTIELHSTSSTAVNKIKKDIEISSKTIDSIKELQNIKGMVTFKGIITSVEDEREITLKNGDVVSFLSFTVSDESDGIRIAIWRDLVKKYLKILKSGKGVILKDVLVKYSNFSGRNEVSLLKDSKIELTDIKIENLKPIVPISQNRTTRPNFEGIYNKISTIKSSGIYEIRGFIAKEIDKITLYQACSKCFKKIDNCNCEAPGDPENRMILNLILDDGSDTIRVTFIGEAAEKVIGEKTDILKKLEETPDFQELLKKRSKELVGNDIIIKGKAKYSDFSNDYELVAYDFKKLDNIEELEKIMEDLEV